MTYDQRICSFPTPDRVSRLTVDGRVVVPVRFGTSAEGMLQRMRGQYDLLYRTRSNTCFLAITVDALAPTPEDTSDDLGVGLGRQGSAGERAGGLPQSVLYQYQLHL